MGLTQHAADLGRFLIAHDPLWRERPFVLDELSWEKEYPLVFEWLRSLPARDVEAAERDSSRLTAGPEPLAEWAREAGRWASTTERLACGSSEIPPRLWWRVPARKRAQVAAFAALVAERFAAELPVIDWCAGRGHLARVVAGHHGRRVTSVEHDSALCRAGAALDARAGVAARWVRGDVHTVELDALLTSSAVVALHACGELHRHAARRAAAAGAPALALVPCCYHAHRREVGQRSRRMRPARGEPGSLEPPPAEERYEPLAATVSDPQLDGHALRLATASEVVAPPRIVARREREKLYRLAIDDLRRRADGADHYRSLPPFPPSWVRGELGDFVAEVSAAGGLGLRPSHRELDEALGRAHERLAKKRALALVRGLFRRPIELWLATDLALWLERQGYRVTLGTFCEPEVTPRNLVVLATARG